MENNDCEQITKVMRECVSENNGSHNCKEIIEKFETLCVKNDDKVENDENKENEENDENKENEEDENSSQSKGFGSMLKELVGIGDEGKGDDEDGKGDEGKSDNEGDE